MLFVTVFKCWNVNTFLKIIKFHYTMSNRAMNQSYLIFLFDHSKFTNLQMQSSNISRIPKNNICKLSLRFMNMLKIFRATVLLS